jgi:uncharacterized protein YndB with AHSA1/START domain
MARLDEPASCVRAGGSYRYVLRSGAGRTFAFSGTYTEVTPHTRLVYTQIFEPTGLGHGTRGGGNQRDRDV